ncbi:shikimate kinase [Silvimonas amylolytica]|uniref:Shikimate kinase n=1 Tax=Silvimonas amylolytica TaxID=449663 RepID=A0ABQ2PR26_9NEIS|nr:shikimate kinase [Silvimonas amylolytica]GGP27851.1 shikimate kinase [Silvimonas amylolytica]
MPGNFFLVGLMGAGKTTVGRALARATGKTFYDSDHEIEARTGVRIPTIFEVEGETGFRARECAVIAELSTMSDIVLATGGGAVLNPDNRAALRRGGLVIYLRASVDDLYMRTAHDKNRPLLQTANPKQRLAELFEVRDPLYREVADLVVDTSRQTVQHLTHQLLQQLEQKAYAHRQA